MSQAASRSRTVFRACVVSAVREGEALMGKLVEVTRNALTQEESSVRNIQQRNNISDALGVLKQHEAGMVKGYSMALLEIFAEGPSNAKTRSADETGMDFGELSLMDESEMQDQVELSKAQQQAVHATEAVLAELNTLVSSAQGLRSVQPERNPLRPENYIRALQRVVSETGAPSEVRQLWMQHMRSLLGKLLEGEYQRMAKTLREQGIEPVGYAVLGSPAMAGRTGYGPAQGMGGGTGYGGGYSTGYGQPSGYSGTTGYGGNTGYGRGMGGHTGWQGESAMPPQMAAEAEEAILTVGILRQMLAGGDPFDPRGTYVAVPSQAVPLQSGQMPAAGWVDGRAVVPGGHAAMASGFAAVPSVAADAMEDIAQLERLVNRLAGGGQAAPLSAWRTPTPLGQPIYTVPFVAPTESPVVAADVVGGMMAALAQDTRLLPSVQRAVQNLEPALKQLVRFDPRFFSDAGHPARRLLDEMTQRSLAFTSEDAPGFAQFVRLINEAVAHLAASQIKDAAPFETVLKALYSAWETQEQRAKAKEAAEKRALQRAEQRAMLAEKIAADIRRLPDMGQVPADVLDFAAGPWADVVALAQVSQADGGEDDPGGYLALVPMLLWSAQPELTRLEPDRLTQAIPEMLAKLREGLRTVDYPAAKTSTFLERLVALHQSAFEMPMPSGTSIPLPQGEVFADPPDSLGSEMPSEDSLQAVLDTGSGSAASDAAADPFANFVVGAWVELITNQRPVRTQLTWASPNGTLFLFTSPDGSTQSMTRRMRDKLAGEGTLRVVRVKSSSSSSSSRRSANSVPAGLARSATKATNKGR